MGRVHSWTLQEQAFSALFQVDAFIGLGHIRPDLGDLTSTRRVRDDSLDVLRTSLLEEFDQDGTFFLGTPSFAQWIMILNLVGDECPNMFEEAQLHDVRLYAGQSKRSEVRCLRSIEDFKALCRNIIDTLEVGPDSPNLHHAFAFCKNLADILAEATWNEHYVPRRLAA